MELWGYGPKEKSKIAKEYNKNRKKKEQFYRNNNLKLISIEASLFSKPYDLIFKEFDRIFSNFPNNKSIVIINHIKHPYFWTLEKTNEELKKIIKITGTFPKRKNNLALYDAMKKYGGINYFRKQEFD